MALVAFLGIGAVFACIVALVGRRVLEKSPRLRKRAALAGLLFAAIALALVVATRLFESVNLPWLGTVDLIATVTMFAAASFFFTVQWSWKALPIPFVLAAATWRILSGQPDPTGYGELVDWIVEFVFLAAGVFASIGALFARRPQSASD